MKMGHQILVLSTEGFQFIEHFLQAVFRVKDSWFVHIIPESIDSLIQEKFIFQSKPAAGLRVQHVREMYPSRPYSGHKIFSIFFFTEVALFYTFFVDRIPLFNFYSRVDDRYQVNMLFLHFFYKFRKSGESFIVQGKVFKTFHIVDIQINAVQRNIQFPVSLFNFPDVLFRLISPAALTESKSPLGRNIAAANHITELFYDIFQILSINIVQIHIPAVHGDHNCILLGVADVKGNFSRIVQEETERFCLSED